MGEIYTCRGFTTAGLTEPDIIRLFDGDFSHGFKLRSFKIAPSDIDNSSSRILVAKLGTVSNLNESQWKWDDQREVGWAAVQWDGNNAAYDGEIYSLVDTDQVLVDDLYIYVDEAQAGAAAGTNYWIEFERVSFPEWRGALAMARDKQSD